MLIYETYNYFELRMKDQLEERSSQLVRNLSSCELHVLCNFIIFLLHVYGLIVNCFRNV